MFSTPEELSEALADATGTNPEEIERGAAALDMLTQKRRIVLNQIPIIKKTKIQSKI